MPRIPPLPPEEMNPDQRRIHDDILRTRGGRWFHGPYDALLRQPRMAAPAQELGNFLRFHTSLDRRLSELAILIVARHWECEFEWQLHTPLAESAGLSRKTIGAIRTGSLPMDLPADEEIVLHFAQSLLQQHRIADADYERAIQRFGTVGVVELTGLIGYYSFLAATLLAHEIPLLRE
jgi:4-carboxymuconolactone decarboxylase